MSVVLVIGALLGLVLSATVSAVETAAYTLNRVRLRVRIDRGDPRARRLNTLMRRPEDIVMGALVGNTAADYISTACLTALLIFWAVPSGRVEVFVTAIATPLVLVFGGIIPKEWALRRGDVLIYPLSLSITLLLRALRLSGFFWMREKLTGGLMRRINPARLGEPEAVLPRHGALKLLNEGAVRGGLTRFQRDLIDRVMKISRIRVGSVMIPRQRSATVARSISRDDFLRIARMAHFSRLTVHDGDSRRIVGVVAVFNVLTDEARRPIAEHIQAVTRLSPATSVSAALVTLQQTGHPMAVVEDSRGHCIGVLTLKDLVEEIVGDLEAW
ncbi:Magnesium and cobalt efflux protein CorC [Phycisphaerae bacterium RAS1]|nr:Magnesium and cobalt efflux protein CorC [Phycisphaerae bacterium RAS1]